MEGELDQGQECATLENIFFLQKNDSSSSGRVQIAATGLWLLRPCSLCTKQNVSDVNHLCRH